MLKAETYAIQTEIMQLGWAQVTDDHSASLPQFPAEASESVPAVLFIRADEQCAYISPNVRDFRTGSFKPLGVGVGMGVGR